MLKVHGSTKFLIFQDSGWLVTHLDVFIFVPFIKSARLAINAEANLRCGVFCPKKVVVTVLAVFFLFGLDYQTFLEFS